MHKKWTNFLMALSAETKLRDRFRDSTKRAKLFEQYDITDPGLLDEGRENELKAAVEAENGLKQVEWWIRAAGARVEANPDYDPSGSD
jgi:hypothetical protein